MDLFCDKNFVLKSIYQDFEKNCMSSGPASEVDAFKRSVRGGFRNHTKNQMHFGHLLGLYFHFRRAPHGLRSQFLPYFRELNGRSFDIKTCWILMLLGVVFVLQSRKMLIFSMSPFGFQILQHWIVCAFDWKIGLDEGFNLPAYCQNKFFQNFRGVDIFSGSWKNDFWKNVNYDRHISLRFVVKSIVIFSLFSQKIQVACASNVS